MSSEKISLALVEREVLGKKVKSLRKQGLVPVVIYEKGKDSLNGSAPILDLEKLYKKAGKHHAVELTLGTNKKLAFIRDITIDPVKHTLTHVAFHSVKQNEKVEAEVPLKMIGQAPAQVAGLLVRLNIDHVIVKGLPSNIPDVFEVDISSVATADDDIRASVLVAPEGVELIDIDPENVLVSVTIPRAEVEKETEEEVAAADVPSDNGGEKSSEEESKE